MFDGIYGESEIVSADDNDDRADQRKQSPEEEYRRLVREWTDVLSSAPGKRGRILRMALASGWC